MDTQWILLNDGIMSLGWVGDLILGGFLVWGVMLYGFIREEARHGDGGGARGVDVNLVGVLVVVVRGEMMRVISVIEVKLHSRCSRCDVISCVVLFDAIILGRIEYEYRTIELALPLLLLPIAFSTSSTTLHQHRGYHTTTLSDIDPTKPPIVPRIR